MPVPLSILICTRNRAEHLRQTLASVGALQIADGYEPELVVVDNASTDGTADLIRGTVLDKMPVRLVVEEQPGLSAARNTALREARGEILLFTDDDVRLPADWIAGMCRPVLNGRGDLVAGKIVLAPHLQRPWMQPFHRVALATTELMNERNPGVVFGASMALSRRVLEKVPGFDPELGAGRLGAGEETLFAWQALQAGFRIAAAFDTTVEHHPDPARLSREAYLGAALKRGRAYTYLRYHWFHEPASHWRHRLLPSVRMTLLLRKLRLAAWRLQHKAETLREEGIHEEEFNLVERAERVRHYLVESRRPRRYERFGARRLG